LNEKLVKIDVKQSISIFISRANSAKITSEIYLDRFSVKNTFKMAQNKTPAGKKSFSVDWLVRGTLTKLGDIFDRLTGRGWKPSSSLATSELIERLKKLLDSEVKDSDKKVKFVPHNIKLKMQWDKFSTDSEDAMKKLEFELLTAVIDHINDNRYHTYAPIKLELKPDYFTEGVKLLASFDKFAEEKAEAELNVTVPNLKNILIDPLPEIKPEVEKEVFIVEFKLNDKPKRVELAFADGQRLSVGRTKENALIIDDGSVSKIHASLVLNSEKQLMAADTGSTNGTFINGKRISYGKAFPISDGDKVKFGTVDVSITHVPKPVVEPVEVEEIASPESAVTTELMITHEGLASLNESVGEESPSEGGASVAGQSVENPIEQPENLPVAEKPSQPAVTAEKVVVADQIPEPKPADNPYITTVTNQDELTEKKSSTPQEPAAETEENSTPPTGQRIVFDFGENK
jgi:pSer/pThr/pTyr-binding forkhead associated (FHA) protein